MGNEPILSGYGAIGTMLPGSDGFYYGLVNVVRVAMLSQSMLCPRRPPSVTVT